MRTCGIVAALTAACLVAPQATGVVVGFSLADPALGMPGGYFDPTSPEGADRFAALMDVKAYVESVIGNPGSVTFELSVFTDAASTTRAKGGQFFSSLAPTASGVVMGDSQFELFGGPDMPGANGFLSFNTAKESYLGSATGSIPPTLVDFRSVILHEMTHALGWASFMKPDDKTSALTDFLKDLDPAFYGALGEVYSVYDTLLVDSMEHPLLLAGAANPDSLPMGGASIASMHAVIANSGSLVPTAVVPFLDGDLTHLSGFVSSTMNPTLGPGLIERAWTPIDLGVLKDMGYVIIPEPSSLLLAFGGAWVLLVRPRRRRGAHAL